MNGIGRILNLLRKETPSPGTDYTGTVTKVEGNVAYVQLAGADINDTPVKMSVSAKKGDTVRVRVNKGRAWITGNDTAPPTDDAYAKESEIVLSNEIEKTNVTLKTVEGVATEAHKIAGNTDQYFWHVTSGTDTGAHLTEIPQDQFLEDPENGGGNLLVRSNGVAIRDGLNELAQFRVDGLDFYDQHGGNIVDIDTDAVAYTLDFYDTHKNDSLAANVPWEIEITSPYFSNFARNGILNLEINGPLETVSFDLSSDYTQTISSYYATVQLTYSASNKTITFISSAQIYLYATLEWRTTIAASAFTFGLRSGAKGPFSMTIGEGLIAEGADQVAIGRYNYYNANDALTVGDGDGDEGRVNLLELKKSSGNMIIKGTLTQYSDRRLKDHRSYLAEDAVQFIRDLKPAHYMKDGESHVGFYAQDVVKSDPWNCMTGEMNGYMTVGYAEIIAPLVAYCQSLEKRIEELEKI